MVGSTGEGWLHDVHVQIEGTCNYVAARILILTLPQRFNDGTEYVIPKRTDPD